MVKTRMTMAAFAGQAHEIRQSAPIEVRADDGAHLYIGGHAITAIIKLDTPDFGTASLSSTIRKGKPICTRFSWSAPSPGKFLLKSKGDRTSQRNAHPLEIALPGQPNHESPKFNSERGQVQSAGITGVEIYTRKMEAGPSSGQTDIFLVKI